MIAFSVEAAPAFIVRAAEHGAFGDLPDIVLSGINNGANCGHAVLHSGTVGAALTAFTFGRPAAAFSIGASSAPHWDTATAVATSVLAWLRDAAQSIVLNVNVPDVPIDDVQGLVPARLAAFGAVQTNITEVGEGYVKFEYGALEADYEPGTDAAALAGGFACFTALSAVCEEQSADTTGLDRAHHRTRPCPVTRRAAVMDRSTAATTSRCSPRSVASTTTRSTLSFAATEDRSMPSAPTADPPDR